LKSLYYDARSEKHQIMLNTSFTSVLFMSCFIVRHYMGYLLSRLRCSSCKRTTETRRITFLLSCV